MDKNSDNPENHLEWPIEKPEPDLVMCDFEGCIERGQYVRCYFDLFKSCSIYKEREYFKRENMLEF